MWGVGEGSGMSSDDDALIVQHKRQNSEKSDGGENSLSDA